MVRRFITDERLRRVFTFQALYAGVPPQRALAVYAVIAYMDTVAGVYFPRGGMRALPDALAAAATDAGVEFRYGATVSALERSGERVTAVHTDSGDRIPADAVVLTTELPDTYRLLGRDAAPAAAAAAGAVGGRRARRLPRRRSTTVGHHTILFGDAWQQTFRDIIDDGRVMGDPSLLVTRPTAGDAEPGAAPAATCSTSWRRHPILAVGKVDWADDRRRVRRPDDATPSPTGCRGSASMPKCCTSSTPRAGRGRAWRRARRSRWRTPSARPGRSGRPTPCAASTTSVLAGSSTVPGVGVPTALMSGRLAADRITGARRRDGRRTTGGATHDQFRTRRRRRARSGAARRLPTLPHAQRRSTAARSSWPPGCWPRSSGPPCTRCTGSPGAPTTSSTTSTRRCTTAERADRLQRLGDSTVQPAGARARTTTTIRRWPRWCTPPAGTASRGSCSTTSSARCAWT